MPIILPKINEKVLGAISGSIISTPGGGAGGGLPVAPTPCREDLIAWYKGVGFANVDSDDDGVLNDGKLEHIGQASAPVKKAQSMEFDGATWISCGPVTLVGDFGIEFESKTTDWSTFRYIMGATDVTDPNSYLRFTETDGYIDIGINGTSHKPVLTAPTGVLFHTKLERVDTDLIVTFTNRETGEVTTATKTSTPTTDVVFDQIGSWFSGSTPLDGTLFGLKITNSSGNVVLDCPGTDAVGTNVPMVINGIPTLGTLNGATLPDFYAEHQDGLTGFNPNELGYSARENLVKYSEDLTEFIGTTDNGSVTDATTVTLGDGGYVNIFDLNIDIGHTYRISIETLAGCTASMDAFLRVWGPVPTTVVQLNMSSPERVYLEVTATGTSALQIDIDNRALAGGNEVPGVVKVTKLQAEDVTSKLAGEYVKTTDTPIQGIQPAPGYDVSGDGVEIFTNPDISVIGDATATWDEGTRVGRIVTDDSDWCSLTLPLSLVVGNRYLCVYTPIAETLGTIKLSNTVEGEPNRTLSGAETFEFVASAASAQVGRATYPTDVTFSISVQEIQITPNYSKDILGNTLQYPKPKLSSKYTGYTGTWDGTAYGVLDSTVTLVGDFRIEFPIIYGNQVGDCAALGGASTTEGVLGYISNSNRRLYAFIDGTSYNSTDTTLVSTDGSRNLCTTARVGDQLTFTVDDNSYTVTCKTNDIILKNLGAYGSSSFNQDVVEYVKLYNSDGTLIHHWVVESDPLSLQDKVYDVVGGNHAQLTNATLPFFTTESEEATYLMLNGWTEGEVVGDEMFDGSNPILGAGWTDNGDGTFTCDGTSSVLDTNAGSGSDLTKWYRTSMTIVSRTSGLISMPYPSGGNVQEYRSAVGDHIVDQDNSDNGGIGNLWIYSNAFVGTIRLDTASYKELPVGYIPAKEGEVEWTPDGVELWDDSPETIETGWTDNGDNSYTADGSQAADIDIDNTGVTLPVGFYQVSYTLTGVTAGSVALRFTGAANMTGSFRTASGSYTETIEDTNGGNSIIRVLGDVNFAGTISNISVQLLESSLASASGSALGQPLTANPNDLRSFEPGYIEMPQDKRLINADIVGQYGADELQTDVIDMTTNGTISGSTVILLDEEYVTEQFSFVDGNQYLVTINGTGNFEYRLDLGGRNGPEVLPHSVYVTATSLSRVQCYGYDATGAVISSITVQELQDPINFFFEPDGDQRQIEYEDLLPTYGDELVTNGGFDADTDWTKGTDWTIANGKMTHAPGASNSSTTQNIGCVVGNYYQVSWDVLDWVAGTVKMSVGGGETDNVSANGSYTRVVQCTTNAFFYVTPRIDFNGSVDNISVKEITATGATMNDQYFMTSKDQLLVYNAPIGGACLDKTEKL